MTTSLLRVQHKGQVTIPQAIRTHAGLSEGDMLEASYVAGKIILRPKTVVVLDRELAEGLDDIRKDRVSRRFDTVDEMLASLKAGMKSPRRQATPVR